MSEYVEANRALWDEWTDIHVRSEFYDVEGFKRGDIRIRDFVLEEVGDVSGKSLLHLQCHFGLDTLSWARLGARVTGVDFSPRAIETARRLAAETGLQADFVHSDVLELDRNLEGRFDIVFTSFGAIYWLSDLDRWAAVIDRFLKPGGSFYIAEFHPFMYVFDDEGKTEDPLRVRYPYFPRREPLPFPVKGSYADPDADVAQTLEYSWTHSIGEIVTALARAGLRIEFLHEYPYTFEGLFPFLEERPDGRWWLRPHIEGEIPILFSLAATKPEG